MMNSSVRSLFCSLVLAFLGLGFLSEARATKFDELASETFKKTLLDQAIKALKEKNFDKALALLDEGLKLSPDDTLFLNARAAGLIQTKQFEEARGILNQLLEKDPQFFQADYNLGEILFLEGKYPEALVHFRRMFTVYNGLSLLRFKVLLCEILSGDKASAKTTVRGFRFPTDGPAWYFAHAALKASDGDLKGARKLANTAREIHGETTAIFTETLRDSKILP